MRVAAWLWGGPPGPRRTPSSACSRRGGFGFDRRYLSGLTGQRDPRGPGGPPPHLAQRTSYGRASVRRAKRAPRAASRMANTARAAGLMTGTLLLLDPPTVTLALAVRKLSVDTVSVPGLNAGSCGLRLNRL